MAGFLLRAAQLATALWVLGCSGEDGGSDAAAGAGGTIDIGGKGGSGATSPGSGGNGGTSGGAASCVIEPDESGCVGESYEGESVPLDIYIMFDQSGSMCSCIDPEGGQLCPDPNCNATRLDAVRQAAGQFLADPDSHGIGVGIGYFGKQPIGEASCNVADYADAAVPIGILPEHAGAINASLAAIEPTGETPTAAAIRGACGYAQSRKTTHPGREIVILLLTDGKPEAPVTCMNGSGPCCPTLSDAVAAAAECRNGNPGIKTYVLGVGPLLQNLQEIAVAGGTGEAHLVESGDVAGQVLAALNRIRGDALPCEFPLPAPPVGQTLDFTKVNITYANAACEPTYYTYVETAAGCGEEGGWHYDDAAAPARIQLCPTSCDQVGAPGGRLLYTIGCTRRVPIE